MKKYDIRILILSRGRSDSISTHKILPEWVEVLVPEDEYEKYASVIPNPILTIPPEYEGLGMVRNWVLDNFKEHTVVMIDDDIIRVYGLTGVRSEPIVDPNEIIQIIINTAVMANDIGAGVFGWHQRDIRTYNGCEPFSFSGWVGGAIGVVGRQDRFRDDKFKVDIDYCLKKLLRDRIIFINNMYYFAQIRNTNVGGNSKYRTSEEYEKSLKSLKDKWGKFIKIGKHKSDVRISLKVPRRQKVDYD